MNEKNYLQQSLLVVAKELQKIQLINKCREEFEQEMSNYQMKMNIDESTKQEETSREENLELQVYDEKDYDIEVVRHLNFVNRKNKPKVDIVRTLVYKVPDVQRVTRSTASLINETNVKITPVTSRATSANKSSSNHEAAHSKNVKIDEQTNSSVQQTNENIVPVGKTSGKNASIGGGGGGGRKSFGSQQSGTFKLTQVKSNKKELDKPEVVIEVDEPVLTNTRATRNSSKTQAKQSSLRRSKVKTKKEESDNESNESEEDAHEIEKPVAKRARTLTPKQATLKITSTKGKKSLQEEILNFIDEIDEKAAKNSLSSSGTSKRKSIAHEETDSNRSKVSTRRSQQPFVVEIKDDSEAKSETTSENSQMPNNIRRRTSRRLTKDDTESIKSDSTENSIKLNRKSINTHLNSVSESASNADDDQAHTIAKKKKVVGVAMTIVDEKQGVVEPERRLTRSKAKLLEKTNI